MASKLFIASLFMVALLSASDVFAKEQKKPKKPKEVKCHGKLYKYTCTGKYACPDQCAQTCMMDCNICKPVCNCNKPGGVCEDPRFIGGDGIMFYFHGKKDQNFCLVSDSDLHINAHFIGKRGEGMGRDFTWVQSIGVLFNGNHQLFLGANKVSSWDDSIDQLTIALDGKTIQLPNQEGATLSLSSSNLRIVRSDTTNAVTVEVENKFMITARVVPITPEESRIHNYGITSESGDCFAHLEVSFKFYSLSPHVTGVLGQTYAAEYRSPINLGVAMPVVGGEANYVTSNLFTSDCKVARFGSPNNNNDINDFSIVNLNGAGRPGGRGMACRR
ncbi:hypothetical protein SUGI_1203520 [Cryptomeria japonica]|uniref:uncharacterized protein LOC131859929 n=1 Tax=Cryptomeria japonica TaxID=3369 RepID=UPI0024147437|nr:uncharacterized protein LOC131859929 [Cryptomeria japonica]GLJ56057.1 hypothetical protein SUGI_1203520 [Cryptomeria japonica]